MVSENSNVVSTEVWIKGNSQKVWDDSPGFSCGITLVYQSYLGKDQLSASSMLSSLWELLAKVDRVQNHVHAMSARQKNLKKDLLRLSFLQDLVCLPISLYNILIYYIILYYIILYYIILYYIILYYILIYYIILYHIILYYIILYYIILHYITLHYITLHYITLN